VTCKWWQTLPLQLNVNGQHMTFIVSISSFNMRIIVLHISEENLLSVARMLLESLVCRVVTSCMLSAWWMAMWMKLSSGFSMEKLDPVRLSCMCILITFMQPSCQFLLFLCANVLMQNFKFKDFCNYESVCFLYTIWFFSSNMCKIAHIFHLLYTIFHFSVMW